MRAFFQKITAKKLVFAGCLGGLGLLPIVVLVALKTAPLAASQTTPIVKADRLVPTPIRVIPITKPDRIMVATAEATPDLPPHVVSVEPLTTHERVTMSNPVQHHDVCAAHHMHKVSIGRGWRCRK